MLKEKITFDKYISEFGASLIEKHLKEIVCNKITQNDVISLVKRIKNNDTDACNQLIINFLFTLIAIARQYSCSNLPFDYLVKAGIVGLIRAAENFNEQGNLSFPSYSIKIIRNYIHKAIENDPFIKESPSHMEDILKKIHLFNVEFEERNKRVPSLSELANTFNISISRMEEIINILDRIKKNKKFLGR